MKRLCFILIFIITLNFLCGCGNDKFIDGKYYTTYGLLNSNSKKDESIEYRMITGNLVWAIILIETVIFPIYFFGFSIFEPVRKRG